MTANTTTVLPDARAQDLADAKAWLCARWHQDHPNEQHIKQLADYAAHLRATQPASDAAVPAGEGMVIIPEMPDGAMTIAGCRVSLVPWAEVNAIYAAMLAAAPKVASDTGAGLREVAAVDSAAFTSHSIGCAVYQQDRASGEPPCICGLKQVSVAALSTDATDGATGGGYPKGATIAVDACGPVDATTPGADLLEQAARVDEPAMERLATMADHGRIDAAYGNFSHPALTMIADVRKVLPCLRALSARNLTEGGEKA